MDPHRPYPLYRHPLDLDFDLQNHQANDPNVWQGNYAAHTPNNRNTTSLLSSTNAHYDQTVGWVSNLPHVPRYLESNIGQSDQQQYPRRHLQHHQHHQFQHEHQHENQQAQQYYHHHQHQHQQQPFSSPSPAAYHTPLSDSHLLTHAAPSPYIYHASPNLYPATSPIPRSMSASAVANLDTVPSQQPQPRKSQPQNSNTFLPTPRQIRFVSSDGQPHAKRRRINAACLTCRKRKTRCSGERPECKTCTDNGHVCAGYAERPGKKNSDKRSDEGDDDDDDDDDGSGSSSSKKHVSDVTQASRFVVGQQSVVRNGRSQQHDGPYRQRQPFAEPNMDDTSPTSNYTAGSSSVAIGRTGVPYFRYFGPTAIVPGFKQMVVQMKDHREHRRSHASASGDSPIAGAQGDNSSATGRGVSPAPVDLPYYDANDPAPNPLLITHLCETFFNHLGCNYPFLQKERFMKDLEDKRVDAILVNSVCATAARFSSDPILKRSDLSLPLDHAGNVKRAFRGQPFAQRAMAAVIDTFSCPTLAVTQACLLLAYEEFGSDKDSGLWMYLGTSIRMAQDLGIQKLEGMQLQGRIGPTPKTAKNGSGGKDEEMRRAEQQSKLLLSLRGKDDGLLEDRRASEQERIDTFWAIFFLDRAVSSGVGRPVTLRDKDIEISFPYRPNERVVHGYPHPFPAMIRIVHMYGRVADVLNNIKDVTQVTQDVLKRLAGMEKDLTGIYQRLSPKLHFNATNFQHYVKHEQGTNFILLHFWFHTLIVLLHQPTLLHSFEGSIQQLFPDSRELSMSSAKTIADILAFAELIDVKSFIGNAFTSQPMYVAACAFLAEAAAHASQPPSRDHTPFEKASQRKTTLEPLLSTKEAEQKLAAKHTLLATAANQNYQRCYKALKVLDSYWGGCRYILTALDQKSKGLMDPLLFTSEDIDGEMPSTEPSFTTPGWRRASYGASLGGPALDKIRTMRNNSQDISWSPKMDWGNAIGWSLTGTGNSPAPNLSFLYQNSTNEKDALISPTLKQVSPNMRQAPVSRADPQLSQANDFGYHSHRYSPQLSMLPLQRSRISTLPYDPVATADGELLLGLHSPYSVGSVGAPPTTSNPQQSNTPTYDYSRPSVTPIQRQAPTSGSYFPSGHSNYGDMMIETQEIDMSDQHNFNNFGFAGGDMLPWLEYLPQDVLSYFGETNEMGLNMMGNSPTAGMIMPSGPGPPDTGQGGHGTPG